MKFVHSIWNYSRGLLNPMTMPPPGSGFAPYEHRGVDGGSSVAGSIRVIGRSENGTRASEQDQTPSRSGFRATVGKPTRRRSRAAIGPQRCAAQPLGLLHQLRIDVGPALATLGSARLPERARQERQPPGSVGGSGAAQAGTL
jgi:hypothetical protein